MKLDPHERQETRTNEWNNHIMKKKKKETWKARVYDEDEVICKWEMTSKREGKLTAAYRFYCFLFGCFT